MSTSPDDIVNLLSRWLAGHVDDASLRAGVERASTQHPALEELHDDLTASSSRAAMQVAVREALEALALDPR